MKKKEIMMENFPIVNQFGDSYSIPEPRRFFDELDVLLFTSLAGASGQYKVLIKFKPTEDKYGNMVSSTDPISYGTINATELNKYSNAEHWSRNARMKNYFSISHYLYSNRKATIE